MKRPDCQVVFSVGSLRFNTCSCNSLFPAICRTNHKPRLAKATHPSAAIIAATLCALPTPPPLPLPLYVLYADCLVPVVAAGAGGAVTDAVFVHLHSLICPSRAPPAPDT